MEITEALHEVYRDFFLGALLPEHSQYFQFFFSQVLVIVVNLITSWHIGFPSRVCSLNQHDSFRVIFHKYLV